MPMFDTEIACPVCGQPLTDVDGMLECQNVEYGKEWHFVWGYGKPAFNFAEWAKRNHPVSCDRHPKAECIYCGNTEPCTCPKL